MKAPFTGVIAKVHVENFQNVQAQEKIVTLISTDDLEATINLPSSVVITSQTAEDRVTFVVFDAAPSVRIPAEFKEAALEADAASQTYEVTFRFEPPDDLVVLPGMNATLIVESTETAGGTEASGTGVEIPLTAVLHDGDQTYVWVIDPDAMTASRRQVTLQDGVGETVRVTGGLEAGETIAGAGANYLAEGMKVRPWTE